MAELVLAAWRRGGPQEVQAGAEAQRRKSHHDTSGAPTKQSSSGLRHHRNQLDAPAAWLMILALVDEAYPEAEVRRRRDVRVVLDNALSEHPTDYAAGPVPVLAQTFPAVHAEARHPVRWVRISKRPLAPSPTGLRRRRLAGVQSLGDTPKHGSWQWSPRRPWSCGRASFPGSRSPFIWRRSSSAFLHVPRTPPTWRAGAGSSAAVVSPPASQQSDVQAATTGSPTRTGPRLGSTNITSNPRQVQYTPP